MLWYTQGEATFVLLSRISPIFCIQTLTKIVGIRYSICVKVITSSIQFFLYDVAFVDSLSDTDPTLLNPFVFSINPRRGTPPILVVAVRLLQTATWASG